MNNTRGLRAERRREELRAETSMALGRAINETGIDQLDLADAAGVDASIISRQLSKKCGNTVTIVDLLMWLADDETRPVALRLVQFIATQSGLEVAEKRSAASAGDMLRLLATSIDAAHGVQRAIADSVCPTSEDGADQSNGELRHIAEKGREMSRVGMAIERAAELELERRTVGPVNRPGVH